MTINGTTYTTGTGLTISGKTWSVNVGSALALGTYDVTATVTRSALNTSDATTGELVVVNGPAVSITSANTQTSTHPTITGTSTIVSGTIIVRIDPNNDGIYTDGIYYSVSTDGSGNWSLNTATNFPFSGNFPVAGLYGPMGVLVTATDTSGASNTASQTLSIIALTISGVTTTSSATAAGTVDANTTFNNVEDNTSRSPARRPTSPTARP